MERGDDGGQNSVSVIRELLRDRRIRNLAIANGLWNFALAALRAFVVLFFTVGLGRSSTFVATVVFPLVAVGIGIAAPLSGWLADRLGHVRLLTVALATYGTVMVVPGITQQSWVMALIPPAAIGAATVMTLPFSMLMRLLPDEHHGADAGLFGQPRRGRDAGPGRGRSGHHAAGPRAAGEQGVRGHVVHVLGRAAGQPAVPAGAPWRPKALTPLPTQW